MNACIYKQSIIKYVTVTFTILLFSLMSGCSSGIYRYSISEKTNPVGNTFHYEIVDSFDPNVTKLDVLDYAIYDEEAMPIVVRQSGDLEPHKLDFSWTGPLCIFTLGLFPAFHGEEALQSVIVETPIGCKKGTYKVESRSWMGWIPLFVGYPAFADERDSTASLPNRRLAKKAKNELVSALVGQFAFSEYVAFAKKENVKRRKEIERIAESRERINVLLKNNKFDQAEKLCEQDSLPRCGSLSKDAEIWSEIKSEIANRREDCRVSIKQAELETRLKESKFEEVVAACRDENDGEVRHASIWADLKFRAEKAISERDRKIELARIETRKTSIAKLLKEKKYAEVISECNKETGANAGWRPEDSAIWSGFQKQAQAEKDKIDRAAEEKRIAAKLDRVNKLLSEKKFADVVALCDEERGQNVGSREDDLAQWRSIRAKALANDTLVLKSFYIGMPKKDFDALCKDYLGYKRAQEIVNASKFENGNLQEFSLSRADVDTLFSVSGVSCEVFAKKLLEAYRIIGEFEVRTEEVPDVERRAKAYDRIYDRWFSIGTSGWGVKAADEYNQVKDSIVTFAAVYRCESKKGFLLEIHEGLPNKFLVLKKTIVIDMSNFD